jgi:hypothetical protein
MSFAEAKIASVQFCGISDFNNIAALFIISSERAFYWSQISSSGWKVCDITKWFGRPFVKSGLCVNLHNDKCQD